MTYKIVNGLVPSYLSDVINSVSHTHTLFVAAHHNINIDRYLLIFFFFPCPALFLSQTH